MDQHDHQLTSLKSSSSSRSQVKPHLSQHFQEEVVRKRKSDSNLQKNSVCQISVIRSHGRDKKKMDFESSSRSSSKGDQVMNSNVMQSLLEIIDEAEERNIDPNSANPMNLKKVLSGEHTFQPLQPQSINVTIDSHFQKKFTQAIQQLQKEENKKEQKQLMTPVINQINYTSHSVSEKDIFPNTQSSRKIESSKLNQLESQSNIFKTPQITQKKLRKQILDQSLLQPKNRRTGGLEGLDLNTGQFSLISRPQCQISNRSNVHEEKQSSQDINHITPQNLLSSTFKNFDDLGDTQKMDDELFRADKNVLNNTFNNLLSFKSGKDLSKTFHQSEIQQSLLNKSKQKPPLKVPKDIPKAKGYGVGGTSRFANQQLQKQLVKKEQKSEENKQIKSLNNSKQTESQKSDLKVGFREYNFREAQTLSQKMLQESSFDNKSENQTPKAIDSLGQEKEQRERIFNSQIYLKKLNQTKSFSPPKRTTESKIHDINHWEYNQIRLKQSNQDQDKEKVSLKEVIDKCRVRCKSEGQLAIEYIVFYHFLKRHLRLQYQIAQSDILEIRVIVDLLLKQTRAANFYSFALKDILNLTDFLLDLTVSQLLELKPMKEMIIRFDIIKKEFQENLNSQINRSIKSESYKKEDEVTQKEIAGIKLILGRISFILMRFGRTVNYLEKINSGFKRFQKSYDNGPKFRNDLIQSTIYGNHKFEQTNADYSFLNQTNSMMKPFSQDNDGLCQTIYMAQNDEPSQTMREIDFYRQMMSNFRHDFRTFQPQQQILFPSRFLSLLKHNEVFSQIKNTNILLMLSQYPLDKKLRIIYMFHVNLSLKYKQSYDKKRMLEVPKVICIICGRFFYADVSALHNDACFKRNKKIKSQNDINKKFIRLSSEATEGMQMIEKQKSEFVQEQVHITTPTNIGKRLMGQNNFTLMTQRVNNVNRKSRVLNNQIEEINRYRAFSIKTIFNNSKLKPWSIKSFRQSSTHNLSEEINKNEFTKSPLLKNSLRLKFSQSFKQKNYNKIHASVRSPVVQSQLDKNDDKEERKEILGDETPMAQENKPRKTSIPIIDLKRLQFKIKMSSNTGVKKLRENSFQLNKNNLSQQINNTPSNLVQEQMIDIKDIKFKSTKSFNKTLNFFSKLRNKIVSEQIKKSVVSISPVPQIRFNLLDIMHSGQANFTVFKRLVQMLKQDVNQCDRLVHARLTGQNLDESDLIQLHQSLKYHTKEIVQFQMKLVASEFLGSQKPLHQALERRVKFKKYISREINSLSQSQTQKSNERSKNLSPFRMIKQSILSKSCIVKNKKSVNLCNQKDRSLNAPARNISAQNIFLSAHNSSAAPQGTDRMEIIKPKSLQTSEQKSIDSRTQLYRMELEQGEFEKSKNSHPNSQNPSYLQIQKSQNSKNKQKLQCLNKEGELFYLLKKLSLNCFDLIQFNHSYKSQIVVLQNYLDVIRELESLDEKHSLRLFCQRIQKVISGKISCLEDLDRINMIYQKTLHFDEITSIKQIIASEEKSFRVYLDSRPLVQQIMKCYQQLIFWQQSIGISTCRSNKTASITKLNIEESDTTDNKFKSINSQARQKSQNSQSHSGQPKLSLIPDSNISSTISQINFKPDRSNVNYAFSPSDKEVRGLQSPFTRADQQQKQYFEINRNLIREQTQNNHLQQISFNQNESTHSINQVWDNSQTFQERQERDDSFIVCSVSQKSTGNLGVQGCQIYEKSKFGLQNQGEKLELEMEDAMSDDEVRGQGTAKSRVSTKVLQQLEEEEKQDHQHQSHKYKFQIESDKNSFIDYDEISDNTPISTQKNTILNKMNECFNMDHFKEEKLLQPKKNRKKSLSSCEDLGVSDQSSDDLDQKAENENLNSSKQEHTGTFRQLLNVVSFSQMFMNRLAGNSQQR